MELDKSLASIYNVDRTKSAGIIVYEHTGYIDDVRVTIYSLSSDVYDTNKWLNIKQIDFSNNG